MARRPRFSLVDLPLHVVQRGNDRHACFFQERDYHVYLKYLREGCGRYGVQVHAYVLMTNHVHLMLTPLVVGAVSRMMALLGARYVRYINRTTNRTGTLWEGRYHASLVECDSHLLATCRYIDLNPVRAGLAPRVTDYRWSSYGALAGLRHDPLVTPHSALELLGAPANEAYMRWCHQGDRECDVTALRDATAGDLAFGSDAFKQRVEAMTKRATSRRPRGFAARLKIPPSPYWERT
ncbi:MAG TPA: transposase [Casimicrobiaceae bacterium]|nr:transposase [Casimicrobiaceae bacterium]